MSNKTSDINVANIEDDVKIVKEFINYAQGIIDDMEYKRPVDVTVYQKDLTSMANILAELEQKDKRIKELEEENAMLRKSNDIVENVNIDDVTKVINKSYEEFMSNYIPKQAVIEAISVHQDYLLNQATTSNPTLDANFRNREKYAIQVLQELLEGGK